jgi:hypothetical protein
MELLVYLVYGMIGGPALALSYGLQRYTPVYCFLTLSLAYIASMVALSLILSKAGLERRFQNRIFQRINAMVKKRGKALAVRMDETALRFNMELGDLGFYLALMSFTFMFGVYWAAVVAFMLRLNLLRSIASMSIGAMISVGFWTYMAVRHNLDPNMVTLFFFGATLLFIAYGYVKENKTLLRITDRIVSEIEKLEKSIKT